MKNVVFILWKKTKWNFWPTQYIDSILAYRLEMGIRRGEWGRKNCQSQVQQQQFETVIF